MPKRTPTKPKPQERTIPIVWDFPEDLVSGYATNMLVQLSEHEFYVSFFEAPPPVLLDPKDVLKLESHKAECIARVVVSPERMTQFVEVLQKQLNLYNEKKKAAKKSNDSK